MPLTLVFSGCGAKTDLSVPDVSDSYTPVSVIDRDAGLDDNGALSEECVELGFDQPEFVDISFEARISSADILFLVDVTGSMSEEITQIRTTLSETLIPAMVRSVPDLRLAVAGFADFGISPYGARDDTPFELLQPMTESLSEVRDAVFSLRESSGGDGPESQVEALYQVATGEGRGRFVPPADCPEETFGAPCFRSMGSPIVLLFTDAEFHNGPGASRPYLEGDIEPPPATYGETVNALREVGAKVLGLYSGSEGANRGVLDLNAIARDTGAVDLGGAPVVFQIGTRGEELDSGVIDVVRRLVEDVDLDIDAIALDDPSDEFDASDFVDRIVTLQAKPESGAVQFETSFAQVVPGTRVSFRVFLDNDLVAPTEEPQRYLLDIALRGDGVTILDTVTVAIVIPSSRKEGCSTLGP
ncbi:MAG: vWA domain-containing protein [Myxococcota bacterium]